MPEELAARERLTTLSDLARVAPRLTAGFGYEFVGREDGLLGLERTYGLHFGKVQPMQQAIQYQAAGKRQISALDVYTTDGRLVLYRLRVLRDDRNFFPPTRRRPWHAARPSPATRSWRARCRSSAAPWTKIACGRSTSASRRGTRAKPWWRATGSSPSGCSGRTARRPRTQTIDDRASAAAFLEYLWQERRKLLARTGEHLGLSALALALGILVAVPLGLLLERRRGAAEPVIRALGLTQTIPSLALLAFMLPFLGIGAVPAVVALWIYSLFPIVRNTYTGVRDADPRAVEAALALGMTPGQVLRLVRLPLAAPILMAGIRTAAVLTVGTATLAAFIGAGGLGEPIVTGLQLADNRMILSGAIPAALLALLVDGVLGMVEKSLRPAGLEREGARGGSVGPVIDAAAHASLAAALLPGGHRRRSPRFPIRRRDRPGRSLLRSSARSSTLYRYLRERLPKYQPHLHPDDRPERERTPPLRTAP